MRKWTPSLSQFLKLTTSPSELPALCFTCEKSPVLLPGVVPAWAHLPCLTAGGNWAPGKTHLGCGDHVPLKNNEQKANSP